MPVISYHQISVPIPIKVSTGYFRREGSHRKSVRRTESAVAVSQENAHGPVGAGDVRDSVVVEILNHSGSRRSAAWVISPAKKDSGRA